MQGDVTKCFLIMLILAVCLISGLSSTKDKPLALGPKIGLHGSVPLLSVGAGKDQDHLVKSAGHSDRFLLGVNKVSK